MTDSRFEERLQHNIIAELVQNRHFRRPFRVGFCITFAMAIEETEYDEL